MKMKILLFSIALLSPATNVKAYQINHQYALAQQEGSALKTNHRFIVAHATGVYAPAINNAQFEKRTWLTNGAYVHYIVGDGGKVFEVGSPGYQAWGAGSFMNANSPVQIELAQTYDHHQFKQDYQSYINLIRSASKQFHIPLNLNGTGDGIKTHHWVSQHVWGNHVDPDQYLASHGVSLQQFAVDLNRISSKGKFINGDQPIAFRKGCGLQKPIVGYLRLNQKIQFDRLIVSDNYTWVRFKQYQQWYWVPIQPVGASKNCWGKIIS